MSKLAKFLPLIITMAATVGAAIFTPAFVAAHPVAFAVVNGLAQVLHSALPSIFGTPSSN